MAISKAFDTIPYESIPNALCHKGLSEFVVCLIVVSNMNVRATIKQGIMEVPVRLQQGMKQGDPLSPFVFNAVLEPLLLQLENHPRYQIDSQVSVSSLAFTDDLVLLATNTQEAKKTAEHNRSLSTRTWNGDPWTKMRGILNYKIKKLLVFSRSPVLSQQWRQHPTHRT
jgi:hypothetical protein